MPPGSPAFAGPLTRADTDYIASGGSLGRLIVRYRTAAHGDWKELRDLILARQATAESNEISYTLATPQPTLASKASGSAVQGVAGIRGLNDGVVPRAAAGDAAAPTGLGAGGPGAAGLPPTSRSSRGRPAPRRAGRGATQWVQYTFPTEETIGRTEVFWTVAPQSWRLLYQEARPARGRQVAAKGAYRPRGECVHDGRVRRR
jgi:hypothetical protein